MALGGGAIVNSLLPYTVHEIQLHREFQTFSRTLKLTWPAPLREIILVLTVTVGHFINNPSQDDRPGQGPSLSEMCARIMGVVAVTASVGIGTRTHGDTSGVGLWCKRLAQQVRVSLGPLTS